jgi:hypothetical protein
MAFPTELTATDWATVQQLISGTVPVTRDLVQAGYDLEGLCLNYAFPAATPPVSQSAAPKATASAVKALTRQQGVDICKAMVAANGKKLSHFGALGSFSWAQLLALIQQILAVVTPLIPATA